MLFYANEPGIAFMPYMVKKTSCLEKLKHKSHKRKIKGFIKAARLKQGLI